MNDRLWPILQLVPRVIVAAAVVYFVASPLANIAGQNLSTNRLNDDIFTTKKKTTIYPEAKTVTAKPATAKPGEEGATSNTAKKPPANQEMKEKYADPVVWAYAIQTIGLLGILGMALWSVVAVMRVD